MENQNGGSTVVSSDDFASPPALLFASLAACIGNGAAGDWTSRGCVCVCSATPEGKCFWRVLQKLPMCPALIQFNARTTWREARGESTEAQRRIIHTVVNRAAKPGYWGTDAVVSVSLKLFQFSCFCHASAGFHACPCGDPYDRSVTIGTWLSVVPN